MDPRDLFHRLEAKYGLPSGTLDAMWAIESSRGKYMRNRATGAAGHFQFLPKTAERYGVSDPNDLIQAAEGAAKMAAENARKLASRSLAVTPQNLYVLHQQGPSGGLALLTGGDRAASEVLSPFYRSPGTAKRAVVLNGGTANMTAAQFSKAIADNFTIKAGLSPSDIGQARAFTSTPASAPAHRSGWRMPTSADVLNALKSAASTVTGSGSTSDEDSGSRTNTFLSSIMKAWSNK